jgi:hypothetical protein
LGLEILKEDGPWLRDKCPVFSARAEDNVLLDSLIKYSLFVAVVLACGEYDHLWHLAHLIIDQIILLYSLNPPQVAHKESSRVDPHPPVVMKQKSSDYV